MSRRTHEICGQQVQSWIFYAVHDRLTNPFETSKFVVMLFTFQVAIDTATPLDEAGSSGGLTMGNAEPFGGYGGPMRTTYGRMYGSLDFDDVSIFASDSLFYSSNSKSN